MISFLPLVGCGLLYSTPVGVICGSRRYTKVSEAAELYDGKSEGVAEWLVLRRGSCALQAAGEVSTGRVDGRNSVPVVSAAADRFAHHTNRKWDVNYLYLLVINTVSLETNRLVHLNAKKHQRKCLLTSVFVIIIW